MNRKFDIVIFDLDSTLVTIEGLDWLADQKKIGAKIKFLTRQAMEGKIDMLSVMETKMAAIAPSYNDLVKLGNHYCHSFVEDTQEIIGALQTLGKEVWIITGNFKPAVTIAAKCLEIPEENVICKDRKSVV